VAIGEAVLNEPFDPTKSAELVVNFRNQPAFGEHSKSCPIGKTWPDSM
jgi:hypothetical protein